MERIERHDGALLPPCNHCGHKPHHIASIEDNAPTTYRLQCSNQHCGLATGEHVTRTAAREEWEQMNADWPITTRK